jgi:hypothetical protein
MSTTATNTRKTKKASADAVAGVFASVTALLVFYPVDVLKTLRQASSSSSSSGVSHGPYDESSSSNEQSVTTSTNKVSSEKKVQPALSRRDWISLLFVGWKTKTLHVASSSFCYFYLHSWIASWFLSKRNRRGPSPSQRMILSAAAAVLNTFLTLPLDVLSTRQQAQRQQPVIPTSPRSDDSYEQVGTMERRDEGGESDEIFYTAHSESGNDDPGPSSFDTVEEAREDRAVDPLQKSDMKEGRESSSMSLDRDLVRKKGWKRLLQEAPSLWKGLLPALILCTNPAIHYTVYDTIKARLLDRRPVGTAHSTGSLNMAEAFVVGLAAKFVATMATYPFIRAKVVMMISSQKDDATAKSLFQCLQEEYQQAGVRAGLYRGCRLQLLHTLLKTALLMMVRERITRTTYRLMAVDSPPSSEGRKR